jgi:hypothetical protein
VPEAQQDTVLNYVNSGMKVNDAYQRTVAGTPEQQQQPEAATPTTEAASPATEAAGQPAAEAAPEGTPSAETTPANETAQAGEPASRRVAGSAN